MTHDAESSSYCGGKYGGYSLEAWYPGDQYVDWVGLSYFTPQDCNWSAVNEVVQFARAHNKPVMICESAPQRYDIGDLTYKDSP
jgi:beta-mannanase